MPDWESWGNEAVYNAIAHSLMQEPLKCDYQVTTQLAPAAEWQNPKSLTDEARGKYQRQIGEIREQSVVFFYDRYSPETVSDYTFDKALKELKRRLDLLETPYAIGTDYWEYRKIAVCMSPEKLSYDIISSVIPGSSVFIKPSYNHVGKSLGYSSDFYAEVVSTSDGNYALAIKGKDEETVNQILETTKAMLEDKDHTIFLTCQYSNIKILSAKIDAPIEDGTIIFDGLPFLDRESITEDFAYILRLICDRFNNDWGAEISKYQFTGKYTFSEDGAYFGFKRDMHHGKSIIERINRNFPVEARRNVESDTTDETIFIQLNEPFDADIGERSAALIEQILTDINWNESDVDAFTFFLIEESENALCRVIVRKTDSYDSRSSHYSCYAIMLGDGLEYAQEIKQAFLSREFFTNMGFYAQKAVKTNAGRGVSASVI